MRIIGNVLFWIGLISLLGPIIANSLVGSKGVSHVDSSNSHIYFLLFFIGWILRVVAKDKEYEKIEKDRIWLESNFTNCPYCGQLLKKGNYHCFCTKCGKELWTCPNCGDEAQGVFCTNCGKKNENFILEYGKTNITPTPSPLIDSFADVEANFSHGGDDIVENSDINPVPDDGSVPPPIPGAPKKKRLKRVVTGLLSLVIIIVIALLTFQEKPKIEKEIDTKHFQEQLDRLCPIPFGNDGEVSSITYDRNKSLFKSYPSLTYAIDYQNDSSLDNFVFLSDEEKKERFAISLLLLDEQQLDGEKILKDNIIMYDLDLVFDIKHPKGKEHIKISSTEIKDFYYKYKANPQKAMSKYMQDELARTRRSLPQKLDDAMTLTDMTWEGDYLVGYVVVDEDLIDMDLLQESKSAIKNSLADVFFNTPSAAYDYTWCKICHTGLTYRFIGNLTEKSVDIEFSAEEISELIQTPEQLHIK